MYTIYFYTLDGPVPGAPCVHAKLQIESGSRSLLFRFNKCWPLLIFVYDFVHRWHRFDSLLLHWRSFSVLWGRGDEEALIFEGNVENFAGINCFVRILGHCFAEVQWRLHSVLVLDGHFLHLLFSMSLSSLHHTIHFSCAAQVPLCKGGWTSLTPPQILTLGGWPSWLWLHGFYIDKTPRSCVSHLTFPFWNEVSVELKLEIIKFSYANWARCPAVLFFLCSQERGVR